MGRLNPRRETKFKGRDRNSPRERKLTEKITKMRIFCLANGGGDAEQSGTSYVRAGQRIKHVHVDTSSQRPRITYE